jgi:carbon storage regulator
MLIITRHKGQRIAIGHDVEIVVTEISRSGVKLGIVAPSSLTILRGEVREAVERANREAVLSEIADPDALLPQADQEGDAQSEPHTSAATNALASQTSQDCAKP